MMTAGRGVAIIARTFTFQVLASERDGPRAHEHAPMPAGAWPLLAGREPLGAELEELEGSTPMFAQPPFGVKDVGSAPT